MAHEAADEYLYYYRDGAEMTDKQIGEVLACFCISKYDELGSDAEEQQYQASDGT